MNVIDFNWSQSQRVFIARVLGEPFIRWVGLDVQPSGNRLMVVSFADEPFPGPWFGFPPPPASPRFPFGFTVEPD